MATKSGNTYGIHHNVWKNWTRTERITALAYLHAHAPLMRDPTVGAMQLRADAIRSTGKEPGKGDAIVARMDATKKATRFRDSLGHVDTKILWSVICTGSTIKETAAWLYGDSEADARYAGRRLRDALENAAELVGTTSIDILTQALIMEVAEG